MIEDITGNILLNHDNNTFLLCDDVKKGRIMFDDENFQSCIGVNFMRGGLELLRVCAMNLMDNTEDYRVVMDFIDKIEAISDNSFERSVARNNIQVKP